MRVILMPVFEFTTSLNYPAESVFAFLCNPANLVAVTPPDFQMELVEAPATLHLGAKVTVRGKRWGFSQKIVSEVTVFQPNVEMADEQRAGPFKKWQHTHHLEEVDGVTRMIDRIDFEAPSGMLGMLLTASKISRELPEIFAYRARKFQELLGQG